MAKIDHFQQNIELDANEGHALKLQSTQNVTCQIKRKRPKNYLPIYLIFSDYTPQSLQLNILHGQTFK